MRPGSLGNETAGHQSRPMAAPSSAPLGETHELVVVGGGLVGLSLGIATAQAGLDTLVVDLREIGDDPQVLAAG